MKKVWGLLAAVLLMLTLAACGAQPAGREDLCFRWQADYTLRADTVVDRLRALEFDEKEIALIDAASFTVTETLEFTADGRYAYGFDKESSRRHAREFFSALFETLYAHRTELADLYGDGVSECRDVTEFQSFYAYLFDHDSYNSLLAALTDYFLDPDALDRPAETGSYEIGEGELLLTEDGGSEALSVGFSLRGDTLTLTYKDDVQRVYSKMP